MHKTHTIRVVVNLIDGRAIVFGCEGSWYEDMEVSSSLQSGIGMSTMKELLTDVGDGAIRSNVDRSGLVIAVGTELLSTSSLRRQSANPQS